MDQKMCPTKEVVWLHYQYHLVWELPTGALK